MFPLGTVLLPGGVLPLHVFEPRYRALVQDCLVGAKEFGVALIERGSEVGGGDVRSDLGTMAGIAEAKELPDGRWALLTVGLRRIRIEAWLDDDPYPRAEVVDWPDPELDAVAEDAMRAPLADVIGRLRRVLALAAEAGDPVAPATVDLAEEPVLAGYQAASLAPVGPLDRQHLLAAPDAATRLALLSDLLDDAATVLQLRLGGGGR
ncbi:MAG: LON peptidase substrate-binding domain-containing protein [Actinomycetota bacterium]|nr:LON peptidase substrate-binding domain-containing protein [Actinomycetota bacterium]